MRSITLFIASSLDGYFAGPLDEIDWLISHGDDVYKSFYKQVEYILIGRKTYDISQKYDNNPFPRKKVWVISRKLAGGKYQDTEFIGADWVERMRDLKSNKGGGIWLVGGGEIIRECLRHHLLDEMIVSIHPIILGEGQYLFPDIPERIQLTLHNTETFDSGQVQLQYHITYNEKTTTDRLSDLIV